jgi:hypothetical protein
MSEAAELALIFWYGLALLIAALTVPLWLPFVLAYGTWRLIRDEIAFRRED